MDTWDLWSCLKGESAEPDSLDDRAAKVIYTLCWMVRGELLKSFSEAGWVVSNSLEAQDEELGGVRI